MVSTKLNLDIHYLFASFELTMKTQIKTIVIFLLSVIVIACNNNPKENSKSNDKSESLTSSSDTIIVIGTLHEGVASFVADSTVLRTDWEKFITANINPCKLNHIEILPNEDRTKYYLVVSGTMESDMMKASIELKQSDTTCLMLYSYTTSCVSSDCSSEAIGCVPLGMACTPCSNKGKCTKTVSNSPTDIFISVTPSNCPD
jgi:hypothetical protein